jgi:hypothetical protein
MPELLGWEFGAIEHGQHHTQPLASFLPSLDGSAHVAVHLLEGGFKSRLKECSITAHLEFSSDGSPD